eukprot:GGOE01002161.1.p1 GENE.GGOE01002161.1~~GGOE01002161.1.p1  ORF type:complete len:403 (+),score=90.88 GGOE01002161.1:77-1285(+)
MPVGRPAPATMPQSQSAPMGYRAVTPNTLHRATKPATFNGVELRPANLPPLESHGASLPKSFEPTSPHYDGFVSPKARVTDSPDSGSGFEAFQQRLKKILSRMDGNLPLNERWQTLGTYLDGYCYDPDVSALASRCTEVLEAVMGDSKLPTPCPEVTAVGCVVLDRLIGWVGHRYPPLLAVMKAVRAILHDAIFLDKENIALQDNILDGDLFGTDVLPVALSVFNGQTYFEALEYADGLLAQANPCPSDAEVRYQQLTLKADHWKKSYVKTMFTAWRHMTVTERHTMKEMKELREQLASLSSYNDTRTQHLKDSMAAMEREIESQQQQIRLLNRAALDAKAPSKAAFAPRPVVTDYRPAAAAAKGDPPAPPADQARTTSADRLRNKLSDPTAGILPVASEET